MASSLGVSTPRWDDFAMQELFRTVRDLAARQTDTDQKLRIVVDRRGDIEQLAQRTEMVHDENVKLRGQLDVMSASIRNHMGAVVDAEVAGNFAHNNLIMQKQIQETIGAFQMQYRQFMSEAQQDIKLLEERIKEQFAWNLEISARDSRRDMIDLNNRVEQAHKIIEDGSDLKRHMADIEGSIDQLSRRVEGLAADMMHRYSQQGGIRGRVESIESQLMENRQAMMATLEELRNDVDRKASDAECQRVVQRVDQFSNEFKVLRTTNSKLEAKTSSIDQLNAEVTALNDRITRTIGDFEGGTLAVSSEIGEIKGRIENMYGKQASVDTRVKEISSQTQQQIHDLAQGLANKLDSTMKTTNAQFESKVSQKVDGVLAEVKGWRGENKAASDIVRDKLELHEAALSQLAQSVDSTLVERLNQLQQKYVELAGRLDTAVVDRKDTQHEMRRELSQVQEVTQGLQEQYDTLLTDAAQRNEIWADVSRELKSRVENAETQLSSWRSMIDTAMDDVRHQAGLLLTERVSATVANVDQLMGEREKQRGLLQRLEDDSKITAKALSELDDRVSQELTLVTSQRQQVGKDILGFKTKLEGMQNDASAHAVRVGKAVLDIDSQCQQSVRELKEGLAERVEEVKILRRDVDFLTVSKIPAIELKIQTEISSGRILQPVVDELNVLRSQVEGMVRRVDFDDIQHEVRALVNATRDVKNQSDRLEMGSRTLQSGLDDVRVQHNQAMSETQNDYMALRSDLTSFVSRFDPAVKKVEQQLGQVQHSVRELRTGEERTQQIVNDVRQEHLELHATLTSATARLEVLAAKPLATEQSVKGLQANLDSATSSMQRDINLMQSHFQEMYDKLATDNNSKTKVMGSAIMELRQKLDTIELAVKEYESNVSSSITEIRGTTEEQAGTLGSRLDNLTGEVKRVRASTQQFEVQLNDTRALSRTLHEMNEKFNTTLDELRASTSGIATELSSVRSRVERQDRANRELVTSEVEGLSDRVQEKFTQQDERLMRNINEANNKVRQAQQTADEDKKKNDDEKNALRNAMTQILQKQEGIDKINEFGVREIRRLREDYESFQNENTHRIRRFTEETDKKVNDKLTEYDTKLERIFQQEQVMSATRGFGAKAVSEVQQQVTDIHKVVQSEITNLLSLFELSREELAAAAEQGTAEQRVRLLLRKPVFQSLLNQVEKAKQAARAAAPPSASGSGIGFGSNALGGMSGGSMLSTSSTIISATDGAPKPGVGLDARDSESGVYIHHIKPGGPADVAGVRIGDYILSVDGIPVPRRDAYKNFIRRKSPSEHVVHELRRGSEVIRIDIQLGNARKR